MLTDDIKIGSKVVFVYEGVQIGTIVGIRTVEKKIDIHCDNNGLDWSMSIDSDDLWKYSKDLKITFYMDGTIKANNVYLKDTKHNTNLELKDIKLGDKIVALYDNAIIGTVVHIDHNNEIEVAHENKIWTLDVCSGDYAWKYSKDLEITFHMNGEFTTNN